MLGLYEVFRAGSIFLYIVEMGILAYCVLSWFRPQFRAFHLLRRFILPFISPFQKLSLRLMRHFRSPIDFSCWFALIGYRIIDRLWWRLYILLARLL